MPRAPLKKAVRRPVLRKVAAKIVRKIRSNPQSGRGFYRGFGKDLGGYIGRGLGMLGTTLTGIPGLAETGGQLGGMAGAYGSSLTGFGAYTVNRNSIIAPSPPMIRNRGVDGGFQIRHREYLTDIVSGPLAAGGGSTAFTTSARYAYNPGLSNSFPWLAAVANQFQQYEINGMVYEYRPTSGNSVASENTALGEVMMSSNYDSLSPSFTSKVQMLNTQFSGSTVPSNSLLHPVECARAQTSVNVLYTRAVTVPEAGDIRMYDLGFLQVATQGCPRANTTLGELWVSYDIILFKPVLGFESVVNTGTFHQDLVNCSNATLFGNGGSSDYNTIGGTSVNGRTISLDGEENANYLIRINWDNGNALLGANPVESFQAGYINCNPCAISNIGTPNYWGTRSTTNGRYVTQAIGVTCTRSSAGVCQINLVEGSGSIGTPTPVTVGDIVIQRLPNNWPGQDGHVPI